MENLKNEKKKKMKNKPSSSSLKFSPAKHALRKKIILIFIIKL